MKISVVMPVYNSEKTIARALDAVLGQEYTDLELLLCDDGSTDGSRAICGEYAARDGRVKLFSLEHGGVSAARNVGLTRAQGEYIAFADSDDAPRSGWLSALCEHAQPDGLSVCGYAVRGEDGGYLYGSSSRGTFSRDMLLSPRRFIRDIFSNRLMYQGYVWNKLFSRKLIEAGAPLRFDERVAYNEDRQFLFWYLLRCGSVYCAAAAQYDYISRPRGSFEHRMLSELTAFGDMCPALRRRGMKAALHCAEKDSFRAAAELFCLAKRAGSADLPYLARYVLRRSRYITEFEDYPEADRERFAHALCAAKRLRLRRRTKAGKEAAHEEI